MLSMMDSNGSTGGVSPMLFNVTSECSLWSHCIQLNDDIIAGSDTSCLYTPPDSSTLASITPNVTGSLTTCQPWGLTIKGGKKPYTVILSALDSPVITNVTMGAQDDVFTYPDRANPDGQLMGE